MRVVLQFKINSYLKKVLSTFWFLSGFSESAGGGSGYVTQYNLNLYESLTELRIQVPEYSFDDDKSAKVSFAEANILLAMAEGGDSAFASNGGNGYSGGGCKQSDGGSGGGSGSCENDNYEPGRGSGLNISELSFQNFKLR